MKVLAFYGSPRKGGNSEALLDAFLKGFGCRWPDGPGRSDWTPGVQSSMSEKPDGSGTAILLDRVRAAELQLSACRGCLGCLKTGMCVIDDGMTEMYRRLLAADLVVVSSPIFFYGLPSQMKAVIDRCQALWCRKYFLKQQMGNDRKGKARRGVFLSVAGTKGKKVFDGAQLTVRYFFDAIDVVFSDTLFFKKIDACGAILDHPSALAEAAELGQKVAAEGAVARG
ncbi:MAG: flavodoxin family protein [Planctomycetota bacterium]|nr:flavodoxin family protein [Planctomycetota bacterium]